MREKLFEPSFDETWATIERALRHVVVHNQVGQLFGAHALRELVAAEKDQVDVGEVALLGSSCHF